MRGKVRRELESVHAESSVEVDSRRVLKPASYDNGKEAGWLIYPFNENWSEGMFETVWDKKY